MFDNVPARASSWCIWRETPRPKNATQSWPERTSCSVPWVTTAVKLTEDDFQVGRNLKLIQLIGDG